jgi:hypothetical protein
LACKIESGSSIFDVALVNASNSKNCHAKSDGLTSSHAPETTTLLLAAQATPTVNQNKTPSVQAERYTADEELPDA